MNKQYITKMGGPDREYRNTNWNNIESYQAADNETIKKEIWGKIYQRYWKPVYITIRRKEDCNENAKDLTNSFFTEIVWAKDLILSADKSKGRFRDFLKHALMQFLANARKYDAAKKRKPLNKKVVSQDDEYACELSAIDKNITSEEVFDLVWFRELIEQCYIEIKTDLEKTGMNKYWQLFECMVVRPSRMGTPVPNIKDVCKELEIKDPATASNMLFSIKEKVCKIIEHSILKTVDSYSDMKEELAVLARNFSALSPYMISEELRQETPAPVNPASELTLLFNQKMEEPLPNTFFDNERFPGHLSTLCIISGLTLKSIIEENSAGLTFIELIKEHYKGCFQKSQKESKEYKIYNSIYYVMIAKSLLTYHKKITDLSYETLADSFTSLLKKSWLPDYIQNLFQQAHALCIQKHAS